MYESYWQLDRRPFENTSDPQFYYPGESHQGAMLKLRYAIENRKGRHCCAANRAAANRCWFSNFGNI